MDAGRESCVIVGVDASRGAERAVDWAAEEAQRRGDRLLISHALSMTPFHLPEAYRGDMAARAREEAMKLLAESQSRVAERHPDLAVETQLTDQDPVESMLELAERADLMVVGSRGLNAFNSVLLGSVSHALVAHAPVPVVVIREGREETASGRGPVVLGMAPDEAPGPVEFAFAEAQWHGTEVLALRTWMYPQTFPGHITVPPDEEREQTARETAEVEQLLAETCKAYPEARVRVQTGLGVPEEALVEASKNAALIVVGSRRHRRRFTMPVGRVAGRVLHHAHCPVAVVPV
jgi:nucleotide-binding universal stress UspA family protein